MFGSPGQMGRNGRLITVAEGFHPGSEVANMSVLGYNLPKVYEGRGPLEAASIGVDLKPGEMAMRCNLICVEGEILKNHSSGHISTEEADVLIQYLQEKLRPIQFERSLDWQVQEEVKEAAEERKEYLDSKK